LKWREGCRKPRKRAPAPTKRRGGGKGKGLPQNRNNKCLSKNKKKVLRQTLHRVTEFERGQ